MPAQGKCWDTAKTYASAIIGESHHVGRSRVRIPEQATLIDFQGFVLICAQYRFRIVCVFKCSFGKKCLSLDFFVKRIPEHKYLWKFFIKVRLKIKFVTQDSIVREPNWIFYGRQFDSAQIEAIEVKETTWMQLLEVFEFLNSSEFWIENCSFNWRAASVKQVLFLLWL